MRYRAGLTGASLDLGVLAELFPGSPGDPYVGVGNDRQWWLAAPALDDATKSSSDDGLAPAVLAAARTIVGRMNGAARLSFEDYRNVDLDGRVRDSETGAEHVVVTLGPVVAREWVPPLTVVLDGVELPKPRTLAARALDAAEVNTHVSAVLRDLATGLPDWTTVGRVLDHITGSLGGGTWKAVVDAGFLNSDDHKRIAATANSDATAGEKARHGLLKATPRPVPTHRTIGLDEALPVVRLCAGDWLDSVCPP